VYLTMHLNLRLHLRLRLRLRLRLHLHFPSCGSLWIRRLSQHDTYLYIAKFMPSAILSSSSVSAPAVRRNGMVCMW
jgi:hypothetical protein